jgi:hypothetical protein
VPAVESSSRFVTLPFVEEHLLKSTCVVCTRRAVIIILLSFSSGTMVMHADESHTFHGLLTLYSF